MVKNVDYLTTQMGGKKRNKTTTKELRGLLTEGFALQMFELSRKKEDGQLHGIPAIILSFSFRPSVSSGLCSLTLTLPLLLDVRLKSD